MEQGMHSRCMQPVNSGLSQPFIQPLNLRLGLPPKGLDQIPQPSTFEALLNKEMVGFCLCLCCTSELEILSPKEWAPQSLEGNGASFLFTSNHVVEAFPNQRGLVVSQGLLTACFWSASVL